MENIAKCERYYKVQKAINRESKKVLQTVKIVTNWDVRLFKKYKDFKFSNK